MDQEHTEAENERMEKTNTHINQKDVVIAILSDKIKFIGKSISRIKGEIN